MARGEYQLLPGSQDQRLTLLKVARAEGVTQQGHATVEKFTGNSNYMNSI